MNSFTRHLLRLATVAMLGFQASSAVAGDLLPPPPPPPPQVYVPAPPPTPYQQLPLRQAVYGWHGTYAGGFVGAQCADIVATKTIIDKAGTATSSASFDGCTAHGGLLLGYNVQNDQIVYGLEADYAMAGNILTKEKDGSNVGMDPLVTLRGRIGYGFNSTLAYLTAGAAIANGSAIGVNNMHMGWVAGCGLEQKLSQNIALRAEYLYADFGSKTYDGGTCCNGDIEFDNVNMARLGLTWHFGQMIAPPRPVYPIHVGG